MNGPVRYSIGSATIPTRCRAVGTCLNRSWNLQRGSRGLGVCARPPPAFRIRLARASLRLAQDGYPPGTVIHRHVEDAILRRRGDAPCQGTESRVTGWGLGPGAARMVVDGCQTK